MRFKKNPMLRNLKTGSLLLAASLATALPAFAGEEDTSKSSQKEVKMETAPQEPRFYVDLFAGGEFDFHATKFLSNGSADFGTVGAFSLPAKIQSRDFQSTHDVAVVNGRFELGYKVLPYLSIFAGGTYSHSSGQDDRRIGSVSDVNGAFGPTGGRYDLYGDFGQYQAFAGMAGIKLNMPRTILDLIHAPKAIKPYLSLSGGGKYLDANHIRFYSGGSDGVPDRALVDTGRFDLYDHGFVFTGELDLGYELQLTRNFSVVVEDGYGFDTKPSKGDLPGTVHDVDWSGDRFYSTVSLGAKLSF